MWRFFIHDLLDCIPSSTDERDFIPEHRSYQPPLQNAPAPPAMPPNYLAQQPVELLDRICFFLLEPRDLLAFASTSRGNHNIVVPRHLQFRRLRSDVRWINIWDVLLANSGVASRFSSLEIFEASTDQGAMIPLSLFSTIEASKNIAVRSWENPAMQRLVELTRSMRGLTRFHWTDTSLRITDQVDFLTALRDSCPALEDILLVNKRILPFQDAFMDERPAISSMEVKRIKKNIFECPLWDLSNLVSFSFSAPGESVCADYSRMNDMLVKRCPGLEDLQFYNHAARLNPLFSQGRWPSLKRISFKGRCLRPSDQDTFSQFCYAHRETLKCIQVDGEMAVDLIELPKLKSLHVGLDTLYRHIPPEIVRNLEHLSLVIDIQHAQYPLLEPMLNLRHLMVAGRVLPPAYLTAIAIAAPNVERLALASNAWMFFKKTDLTSTNGSFNAFLEFLSRFPRLTHYSRLGIAARCDPSHCCELNNIMERIAGVSPTLQYIDVTDGEVGRRRWLALERYPVGRPGAYANWDIPRDYKSLRPHEWGGFYPFETINPGGCPWSGVEPS